MTDPITENRSCPGKAVGTDHGRTDEVCFGLLVRASFWSCLGLPGPQYVPYFTQPVATSPARAGPRRQQR